MLWPLSTLFCCLQENLKDSFFSSLSRPIDAAWYSFTFISAAYEPDMIYAVPLTSLSPSSFAPSRIFLHCSVLLTFISSSSLHLPAHTSPSLPASLSQFHPLCPLPPLRRALCPMGIRVAQQTTSATARRGKLMRRSSWQTMWGRFHSALKCLSNCKKVPSNSASSDKTGGVCVARGQQTFKSCSFFQSNWNSFTFCCAYFAAGVIVRDQIYQTLRGFVLVRDKCLLLSRSSELSTCSRPKIKTQACSWEDFTCPS